MKNPTQAYVKLKANLKNLKSLLKGVPETQNSSTVHHLKVQSYIVLSHAAFEEYIENVAKIILDESVLNYNKNRLMNICIMSLVAAEAVAQVDPSISRRSINEKVVRNLSKFINFAHKNHQNNISANLGIKLRDQKNLLIPVGLDPENVDSITAVTLDAFGTKRGGVAHQLKIQSDETKSSVLTTTKTLLLGLKNYDLEATKIINNTTPY